MLDTYLTSLASADPGLEKCLESDEEMSSGFSTDASLDEWYLDDDIISGALCTCGADGRAHKKDCPMNSRKRHPGRALFPSPSKESSPMPVSSEGGLEPAAQPAAPNKSLKPPPAKRRKPVMKVGDYVCIHSSLLGKCHIPCRIVRDFGDCYQLYCSKGVLNTSFSGRELIPLSGCCSIPLDKWNPVPKVSLHSVAGDPAVVEHCDCNLSQSSESIIVISSASEDEDTESEMWVKNDLYSLTRDDRRVILSPTGWLTDKIITTAQMLMLQHFPNMAGLQPPPLQKFFQFDVHCGEFVQIINVRNNHWCVVSTVGCEKGVVNVYDSLYSSVLDSTTHLIASMVSSSASKLVVRMMDVERQSNGSDCGVLAVAYIFDICSGFDPCMVKFNHKLIRQHLVTCLENCQFSRFPLLGERTCSPHMSIQPVDLHCSCHMPEAPGDEMALCDSCQIWYHRHCMDIPSDVFGELDIPWVCKACCNSSIHT